jgi:hypothetical protein
MEFAKLHFYTLADSLIILSASLDLSVVLWVFRVRTPKHMLLLPSHRSFGGFRNGNNNNNYRGRLIPAAINYGRFTVVVSVLL